MECRAISCRGIIIMFTTLLSSPLVLSMLLLLSWELMLMYFIVVGLPWCCIGLSSSAAKFVCNTINSLSKQKKT